MRGTRLWLVIAMIIGLLASAIVAGCGDDDDDSSGGSDESTDLGLIQDGTLIVASDIPYPPFEQGDPPDYEGFDIDLINAVADEMGLEIEMQDQPFEVILAGQQGRFDLSIAATTIKPARENRVDFSDPYFEASQSLLVATDSDIESVDDITSTPSSARRTPPQARRTPTRRPTARCAPTRASTRPSRLSTTARSTRSSTTCRRPRPPSRTLMATSRSSRSSRRRSSMASSSPRTPTRCVDAVNEALATVKEDGTLDEIYQEWFGTDAPDTVLEATHEPT